MLNTNSRQSVVQCFLSSPEVLITVPLRALQDQFALDFPGFCKVGQGHNQKINFDTRGFIAVTKSVHLLQSLKFQAIFVDEAHHPLPSGMPKYKDLYRFSATHTDEPDFRYTMGQAIDEGVLCDYDITVPAVTEHHAYVCLADLLLKQAGRFRRVLAYCNSISEAKMFQMVLEELGLAAWHINAATSRKRRMAAIEEFSGDLTKPVHVMVSVEVLGEGINIPNADTCIFVEPRNSYRSVIQAIGRVLRHHPSKTLAHIVLPAVAVPAEEASWKDSRVSAAHPYQRAVEYWDTVMEWKPTPAEAQQEDGPFSKDSSPMAAMARGEVGSSAVANSLSLSLHKRMPRPVCSNNLGQDLVATTSASKLRESRAVTDRGSTIQSPRCERLADMGTPFQERPTNAAGVKKDRNEAFPCQFRLSSDLSPVDARSFPKTSGRSFQVGPHTSAQLGGSVETDEKLKPCAMASQNEDTLQSLAFQRPSDEASAGHAKSHVVKGEATTSAGGGAVDQDETYSGPDIRKNSQEQEKWQMMLVRQPDTGSIPSTHRLQDAKPYSADQEGQSSERRAWLGSSTAVSGTAHELFSTQLERFLSLLVQADSRLLGSNVGHRIQLVDCRRAVDR